MIKKVLSFILSIFVIMGLSTLAYAETAENDENSTIQSEYKVLIKDVDYTLEYKDNIKPGTATVIINFIGNYSGQIEQNFNITPKRANSGNSHKDSSMSNNTENKKDDINNVLPDITEISTLEHHAYINGYEDGTFKPDGYMTRAEAAAIFARLIADEKGETISGESSFKDVSRKNWYNNYISYLEKYKVISGYNDSTFRPDEQITRAEFVTMCMRFYELDSKAAAAKKNIFNDVPKSHWASDYIYSAVGMGWINGYSDSTFKPNSNITRAEVVTIVNRTTLRTADKEFVKDNFTKLNRFTDVTDSSKWYFFEVNEAANTHKAATSDKAETWVK